MTRDIVDRLRDAAEVEGGTSPDYGGMLEDAADTIASLIAERDAALSELDAVVHVLGVEDSHVTPAERATEWLAEIERLRKYNSELAEGDPAYVALIAERDKLTSQLACVSYNFEERGKQLRNLDDKISALEAERDKLQGQLKTVAEMGCRNCAPTRAEWKKCQAERDEWKACFLSMREERDSWQSRHALRVRIEHAEIRALKAERDKLLKDRSDLAQQIDNDTDCIAKLKEADDLDIMPTLAKAYREIAELKEEVERLNNELNIEQMDSLTGREWAKNLKAENLELRSYSQASTQTYQEQIAKLKKEVELVRAERHRAQTACAQMGERVSVLTEALQTVRTAIIEKAPDTLWAGLIETAVDHIDNALSRTSEDAK